MNDQTLTDIQNRVTDLIGLLRTVVEASKTIEDTATQLKSQQEALQRARKLVFDKDQSLMALSNSLNAQKVQLDGVSQKLAMETEDFQKREDAAQKRLTNILEQEKKMEMKEREMSEREGRLLELEDKSKSLETALAGIASEKALIEKEKEIDRDRKKLLDIRESKIHDREIQLQRVSEQTEVG